jgi:hypothetical protein
MTSRTDPKPVRRPECADYAPLPFDVRRFVSGALRFEHLMSELHRQEQE